MGTGPTRRLVINADDFGYTRDVNEGILEAHRRGVLTATTLMANGSAFDHAVALAKEAPSLDVGCHLVLVGGGSVANPGLALPASVGELLKGVARGRVPIEEELTAQVRKVIDAGIQPTHLDTHKHTHLLPPVLDVVARLSREFRIPWVRRPFDFPLEASGVPWTKRAVSQGLSFLRRRFHRVLERQGCRTTDHFAGFQLTGRFRTAEFLDLIRQLPAGSTEFMCHPGFCTDELRTSRTRLKQSREEELRALVAAESRAALLEAGIELVNYRDLGGFNG